MKTITKLVGYAYPTSPIADALKAQAGCWYVATRRAGAIESKPLSAHATQSEAQSVAETMPQPFDRWTYPIAN